MLVFLLSCLTNCLTRIIMTADFETLKWQEVACVLACAWASKRQQKCLITCCRSYSGGEWAWSLQVTLETREQTRASLYSGPYILTTLSDRILV